jgi:16S rRNA (cytosine967-C5)-methyltransferase
MNLASLVGHITELLQLTHASAQPVDRVVAAFFHSRTYLGSRDRRFISDALYGIIRNRRYLEALLEELVDELPRARDLDLPQKRFLALYALHALTAARQASDEIVPASHWTGSFPDLPMDELRRWVGAHRELPSLEGDTLLAVRESFQDWMVERWRAALGEELPQLLASLNVPAEVTLRVNALRTTREECAARLALEGIATTPSRYSAEGLIAAKRFNAQASKAFAEGWYEVQDEGSQIVSLLSGVQPGQTVIDGCAGAGGKALHLASLMRNEGEIVAIDNDQKRLRELERRVRRGGVGIVRTTLTAELVAGNLAGVADLVLVDAPCSGSGTIRRNPSFKWSISEALVAHYQAQQSAILAFNAAFVKPGGRLVYATCSLFRDENEGVIEPFLASNPGFRAVALARDAERLGVPAAGAEMLTLYPHRTKTDGFFIAVLERAA